VRRIVLLSLVLAIVLALAVVRVWLANKPSEVEREFLSAAREGAFSLPTSSSYDGQVDCRVSEPDAFRGQDIFLCKLGVEGPDGVAGQYLYVALVDGRLHTHETDPITIPGRVFDPGF
jgi:hypothetical protein